MNDNAPLGPPLKKNEQEKQPEWFPYKPGIEQDKYGRIRTNNTSPYGPTYGERKPI